MGCNSCDCVDRFDLEDHILRQLDICDMIELVVDQIRDQDVFVEVENIVKVLEGISRLHRFRNDKLFDVFTRVHELDQYGSNYKHTVKNDVKHQKDWLYKPCSDSSYSED